MTLPRPRTIRARLTLTTTVVMGLVLLALGFLIDFGTAQTVLGSIDNDLKYRGHQFAREMRREGGGRPPGPPPDGGLGRVLGDLFGGPGRRRGPDGPPGVRGGTLDDSRPRFIPMGEKRPDDGRRRIPGEPFDAKVLNAAAKKALHTTIERNGGPFRVYSEPVVVKGELRGIVQVGRPLGDALASLAGLRRLLLTVVVPLGALLAGLASLFLVNRMLRPLRVITENARTIGGGNPEERLPVIGDDEFAGLATTLNGMLARLEEAFRLEQATTRRLAETVEQQRRFTADASHELKTPLSTIKAHVGLMTHLQDEDDRESVDAINEAANRMRGLVDDLLVLARADGGSLTARTAPVDLGDAVGAAVGAVSPMTVEVRGAPRPLVVQGNGEALTRLFINLLDNAKKYAGGPVEVHLARRGSSAEVTVADRGVGIAPEHLPRLFDRFYRPDTSRTSETGGTGLGLAICKEIAAAHGGTIEVASKVGQGTALTVVLPLAS